MKDFGKAIGLGIAVAFGAFIVVLLMIIASAPLQGSSPGMTTGTVQ